MTGQFEDDDWGQVVNGSGDFARVDQLENHLLIVYPRGYIEHHPTKFSQPGKKSDVIVCDVVDLDAPDDNGQAPGKVYRNAWWRQSQLIISLRPFIDKRVLGRITKGISRNGMNPPWVIGDSTAEPGAIERARTWAHANPNFALSPFDPNRLPTIPAPPPAGQYGGPPQGYQQQFNDPWAQQAPPPQYPQPAPPQYQQPLQPQYQQPQPQYQQPAPGTMTYPAQGYTATSQAATAPPPPQYQQAGPASVPQGPPAYPVQGSPPVDQSMLAQMRAARERRTEAEIYGTGPQSDQPPF